MKKSEILSLLVHEGWGNASAMARVATGPEVEQRVALVDLTEDRQIMTDIVTDAYGEEVDLPPANWYVLLVHDGGQSVWSGTEHECRRRYSGLVATLDTPIAAKNEIS